MCIKVYNLVIKCKAQGENNMNVFYYHNDKNELVKVYITSINREKKFISIMAYVGQDLYASVGVGLDENGNYTFDGKEFCLC